MTRKEKFTTIILRSAYTLATELMNNHASVFDDFTKRAGDSPAESIIACNLNIAVSCYAKCVLNLEQVAIREGIADDNFYNGNSNKGLECDILFDKLYSATNILLEETDDENCRDFLEENMRILDFLRG